MDTFQVAQYFRDQIPLSDRPAGSGDIAQFRDGGQALVYSGGEDGMGNLWPRRPVGHIDNGTGQPGPRRIRSRTHVRGAELSAVANDDAGAGARPSPRRYKNGDALLVKAVQAPQG
ncbi:hypothetical protein, partial [Frankia sp. CiP3]|uniref:hypothetical protein n=1 Tax=Frankia sp. CiP3 TaxID=2880971 RepID=UPI001EF489A2